MRLTKFADFLNEENNFGFTLDDLKEFYRIDDDPIDETPEEIEKFISYTIKNLNKIKKQSNIKLYRIIYIKDIKDLDKNKLGLHYVADIKDFQEEMVDYLYRNALKKDKTLKESDVYLIEIETPTSNIDYTETIRTNMMHPWESEIMILNDKLVKIKSIKKF